MIEWKLLRSLIKNAPRMTSDQELRQRLSFAYGNLACSTNHKPKRVAFKVMAMKEGMTAEEFDEWAANKEWWP